MKDNQYKDESDYIVSNCLTNCNVVEWRHTVRVLSILKYGIVYTVYIKVYTGIHVSSN